MRAQPGELLLSASMALFYEVNVGDDGLAVVSIGRQVLQDSLGSEQSSGLRAARASPAAALAQCVR